MKIIYLTLIASFLTTLGFGKSDHTPPSEINDGKILIVVSNVLFQGNSSLPAGNSFSEIVIAYDVFVKAGFDVDFVSPKGGMIPLSYINTSDSLQSAYLYNCDFMYQLKNTLKSAQINPQEYCIVHYTGGSSPIFDIPQNEEIQDIAMAIYNADGVISAVCHGTSGIVNLKTKEGQYLVAGKNVNGVPDSHESKGLPHYKQYPFIIESVLKERGGIFKHSKIGTPHVEIDGRLITGQNSLSSLEVALKSIEILKKT